VTSKRGDKGVHVIACLSCLSFTCCRYRLEIHQSIPFYPESQFISFCRKVIVSQHKNMATRAEDKNAEETVMLTKRIKIQEWEM
jgi:hypothetical protein